MENEIILILPGFIAGAVCFCLILLLSTLFDKEDSKKKDTGQKELPTKRLNLPDELKTRDERIDRLTKEGWLTIVVLRTIVDALPPKSRKEYEKNLMYHLSRSVGGKVEDMEELIELSDYILMGQYIGKYDKK